jgi:chromosome partitioning protein
MLGVLITMVGPGGGDAELCKQIRTEYRDRVFETEINASRALKDAPGAGRTIFGFAPRSRAAGAFRRLAEEVLERARVGRR